MLIEKLLKVALLGSSWVMYLLLGLSVLSISTMIERFVYFRRHRDDIDELGERLIALLEDGDLDGAAALLKKSRSIEASALAHGLRYFDRDPDAVAEAVSAQMLRERRDLERGNNLLGTLGNNAPFIGLLGTVIGVIVAFHQLGSSQSSASMSAVMGGIAEALVATGVGLFVALPAVVAYNVIQKQIADIEDNVAAITKDVIALLKAGAGRSPLSAPGSEPQTSGAHSPSGVHNLAASGSN